MVEDLRRLVKPICVEAINLDTDIVTLAALAYLQGLLDTHRFLTPSEESEGE
jgi:hypothetical protein